MMRFLRRIIDVIGYQFGKAEFKRQCRELVLCARLEDLERRVGECERPRMIRLVVSEGEGKGIADDMVKALEDYRKTVS